LPGLMSASPNTTEIQRLAEAVAGSANVAVVVSEMPPDSWIREACIQLDRCGVQLKLVISKSALARDTSPTGDAWMVTTGSGMSAMPLGRNAPGTHLIGWSQASKSMYEQFVECARNEKGRDLGQLKISRGRLLAAVHASLLSDSKAKTIAVGADGHAVEYSPRELDACLAGLRREVSERLVGVVPNDATVVVTDDAAAWMGPGIGNGRAMRVLALRHVYERTRVILAACAPEPGSVLVVEDMIGQPRTLSWLPGSQTIEGLPNKWGWPRAAVIAVASLGLAWVSFLSSTVDI